MDKDDNPGHSHEGYVPLALCAESRAHMETKLNNMSKSIRWSVYLSGAVLGIALMLFQWYLTMTVN